MKDDWFQDMRFGRMWDSLIFIILVMILKKKLSKLLGLKLLKEEGPKDFGINAKRRGKRL